MTEGLQTRNNSGVTHDFGIVIPTLDQRQFLPQCLRSIFSQEGEFTAHIHIQNAGLPDLVEEVAAPIVEKFSDPRFHFTFSHYRDRNVAEGINLGVESLQTEMITWLGSDDILLPGCLSTIKSLREAKPQILWITGQHQTVDESGIVIPRFGPSGSAPEPSGFPRAALKIGEHFSLANLGAVQQEGTFWHSHLWREVGGVSSDLSLAFDFDLWSRMAMNAELVAVAVPLAAFRRRRGQLSSAAAEYERQVRKLRSELPPNAKQPEGRFIRRVSSLVAYRREDRTWDFMEVQFVLSPRLRIVGVLPSALHLVGELRRAISPVLRTNPALRILSRALWRWARRFLVR